MANGSSNYRTYNGRGRGRSFQNDHNSQYQKASNIGTKEFWCETCDRDFKTSLLLEDHNKLHQKCNIDGCQFVAHPNIITKHIQMQHASGLYKKIAKLADPEEIKKWRDERKLKYPTKINIEKKNAENKEKIERGEKISLKRKAEFNSKYDKKNQQHDYLQNQKRSNSSNKNKKDYKNRDVKPLKIPKPETVIETEKIRLKPFAGIQDLVYEDLEKDTEETEPSCNVTDEEDNFDITEPVNEPVVKHSVCGALSSLICDYGSSEDEGTASTPYKENEIKPKKSKIETHSLIPTNLKNKVIIKHNHISDDDSGPEEVSVARVSGEEHIPTVLGKSKEQLRPITKRKKVNIPKRNKPKLPSTLLTKLLAKEIKHERNVILQCVRHIVNNNYFDK